MDFPCRDMLSGYRRKFGTEGSPEICFLDILDQFNSTASVFGTNKNKLGPSCHCASDLLKP